jgi:hypothetical protein
VPFRSNEYAIGEFCDLVESMRDVDDADALVTQSAYPVEELVHFLLRERRGGLIEHENSRLVRKGARNLYDLPLTDSQRPNDRAGVDGHPHRTENVLCALLHGVPVDHSGPAGPATQADVLGNRQRPGILELLADHSYSEPTCRHGCERRVGLGVDLNDPVVGGVVTGEDLHQGRLARSVLAEQGEDGAAGGVEVHTVEDLDTTERLTDATHRQGDVAFNLIHGIRIDSWIVTAGRSGRCSPC